ncbi:MAG: heparinase II/III family protein [Nitrospira sp.]|nr:heparinase II/III family protein [Nitrospira sp.]
MERLLLFARTVSYLRPNQVFAQVLKRVRPSSRVPPARSVRTRSGVNIGPSPSLCPPVSGDFSFCFLNRTLTFPSSSVDWASPKLPKLWRYNLHYFDYLADPARPDEAKCRLIADWIAKNPIGVGDGWEPYPVSLRIVNWVKFFLRREKPPETAWLDSLWTQAAWLERNLEYHLLANHLFKNAVALVFAGVYFEGPDADRWLRRGWALLRQELAEQFLPDGGHYERSPMYHSICLSDCLDVVNLIERSAAPVAQEDVARLQDTTRAALGYLHDLCLPDGNITLFNDAAFGIAPSPKQIFQYADALLGYEPPRGDKEVEIRSLPASGYYVIRNGGDRMVIDCGSIGPDYQPGHAHCDTLSYELAIDGRRMVVDSGVYDYESSPERAYARSTRAHNTVMVDGVEQSEVWGVFRVARRARPIRASLRRGEDGRVTFDGAHDGYRRLPGRPIHSRTITYDERGEWVIEDRLDGRGEHRLESYVHLHPDFQVVRDERRLTIVTTDGRRSAVVEPLTPCDVRIDRGWYFPEFGMKYEHAVIVFARSHEAPFEVGYRIRKAPMGPEGPRSGGSRWSNR